MYELLASFAQTWGMLLFITLFIAGGVYALWPKNQAAFDEAASLPLMDDDRPAAADDVAPSDKDVKHHG